MNVRQAGGKPRTSIKVKLIFKCSVMASNLKQEIFRISETFPFLRELGWTYL